MNYLILSKNGNSFLVSRLGQTNSTEKIYFWSPKKIDIEDVKVEIVKDYGTALLELKKDNAVIIVDGLGLGNMADYLKKEGWKVIGGSAFCDQLEDENFALKLAGKIMKTSEIEGIEVNFGGWFNGEEFIQNSLTLCFENRQFMTGDIGIKNDASIAVQIFRPNEGIFMEILNKLTPLLKKIDYKGQFSIKAKIGEDKVPYFIGFVPCFSPTLAMDVTMLEDNDSGFPALVKALSSGDNPSIFKTDMIGGFIRLSVPNGEIEWNKKYDTYFFPHCDFVDLACSGATLDSVVKMVYDTYIPSVKTDNLQFRNDLGGSAKERLKKLRELKLI